MRITAIADGGRPEERAKMVARVDTGIVPHGSAGHTRGQAPSADLDAQFGHKLTVIEMLRALAKDIAQGVRILPPAI